MLMTGFYTSICKYGNKILYRGYDNQGKRVEERVSFKPTLYLESKNSSPSQWQSLAGSSLEPMKFNTMREAGEFIKL